MTFKATMGVLSVITAMACMNRPLVAQDQPVVFVHGLTGNAGTWANMRDFLQAQLQITGSTPTLGWGNSYGVQAGNLHTHLQGLNNVIAIGHSNGGVVSREYLISSSAPRIDRHISVNSPHRGAKLAEAALNGDLARFADDLTGAIAAPIAYYFPDQFFQNQFFSGLSGLASFLFGAFGSVDDELSFLGFASAITMQTVFGFVPDVLDEMRPSSFSVQQRVSQSAISTEASRALQRFSISNELAPDLQPFSIVFSNSELVQAARFSLIATATSLYWHYAEHPNFELRQGAFLWLQLAATLSSVPFRWAELNGAFINSQQLWRNDGIVTWESSMYPGGSLYNMPIPSFPQVPHTSQTTSPAVAEALRLILRSQMGVQERSAPPLLFSASIIGPTVVAGGSTCTFSAGVTAGVPPFSYEWRIGQSLVSQASSFAWTFGGLSSDVSLTVTDASGASRQASQFVAVDPYAAGCGW